MKNISKLLHILCMNVVVVVQGNYKFREESWVVLLYLSFLNQWRATSKVKLSKRVEREWERERMVYRNEAGRDVKLWRKKSSHVSFTSGLLLWSLMLLRSLLLLLLPISFSFQYYPAPLFLLSLRSVACIKSLCKPWWTIFS